MLITSSLPLLRRGGGALSSAKCFGGFCGEAGRVEGASAQTPKSAESSVIETQLYMSGSQTVKVSYPSQSGSYESVTFSNCSRLGLG